MDITERERKLLKPLTHENAVDGLPAGMRYVEEFGEMERKGLVSLSAARTGLFRDPEIFWVRITDTGRKVVSTSTV